ncbi:hypothetical protein ACFO9Q_18870 [Paenibacillus sp. GCM10023252]|uniref:hypothetical protein n=1 Tax=Paenibacillus sp. GCM10023252 TaxID=3252649 RepID=UPI0036129003
MVMNDYIAEKLHQYRQYEQVERERRGEYIVHDCAGRRRFLGLFGPKVCDPKVVLYPCLDCKESTLA